MIFDFLSQFEIKCYFTLAMPLGYGKALDKSNESENLKLARQVNISKVKKINVLLVLFDIIKW